MNTEISEIRAMTNECEKVKGINLAQGICDLETPQEVQNGAIEAIKGGQNTYSRADGVQALRLSVSAKLAKFNKITADPEKNIIITNGATGGFYCAARAILHPGDEVLIFEPFYSYHVKTLEVMGVSCRFIKMQPPDWTFAPEDITVTEKTRAIIINTPANPCGKVFSETEIKQLEEICARHNLYIFTDEVYEYFIYDGVRHISPGLSENLRERTITISSYSKTFSITGWRIGYCVCNDDNLAGKIKAINDLVYVCSPSPFQFGVAKGIDELGDDYYLDLQNELKGRRDLLCSALNKAGFEAQPPAGAYYILADIGRLPGKTSKDKAMYLLHKTGIASVPGNEFFSDDTGNNFARFCFAKKDEALSRACENLLKL
jgi:aminotransferase